MMGSLLAALTFLTRLPWPGSKSRVFSPRELAGSSLWFGVVGALIGAIVGCSILLVRGWWPPLLVAVVAVGIEALLTGALHLDGLADCADSCGGHTTADRLRIMKDHAIGVYGTVAVVLALALRTVALAAIAWQPAPEVIALTTLAWSLSRVAVLLPARALPYAREQGTGREVIAGLTTRTAVLAVALLLPIPAYALWTLGPLPVVGAVLATLTVAGLATWWAMARLGGATGDVLGASAEVALGGALLAMLAALS